MIWTTSTTESLVVFFVWSRNQPYRNILGPPYNNIIRLCCWTMALLNPITPRLLRSVSTVPESYAPHKNIDKNIENEWLMNSVIIITKPNRLNLFYFIF